MISERRRFSTLHVLQPLEILACQLTEGDAAPAAVVRVSLEQRLLRIVLMHKRQHPRGGLSLGQDSLRRTAASAPPAAVAIRLHPCPAKRTDDRLTVARPLAVEERACGALPDERSRGGLCDHRTDRARRKDRPGNGL